MNQNKLILLGVIGVIILLVASQFFYTVREDKQALVLNFGEPVRSR